MRLINNKCIYLVFSKSGTWLSKSIGKVTNSKYTHVSLSLDDNFDNMYSFGRINPNNPIIGGLVKESLYEGVYKRFLDSQCLIYRIWVTEEQLNDLKKELELYLNSTIRYRYNFIGLFAVLLDKPIKREKHYFCSEFVTTLLGKSNIWKGEKVPELTRPMDLVRMENKEVYYEGTIGDFVPAKDLIEISI